MPPERTVALARNAAAVPILARPPRCFWLTRVKV